MKNLFLILFTLIIYSTTVFAQEINITNTSVEYNDKARPSLSVTITPDTKEVKKKWKDFMDDNYDINVKGIGFLTNKDVLTAERVTIDKISNKQLDLYAKVMESNGQTRMDIFAAPGYDIYINPESSPRAYAGMRLVLVEFLNYYLPNYYQEKVDDARDEYQDLVDSKEELENDIEDNINDIDKLRKEIEDLRNENKSLGDELVETRNKLYKSEKTLQQKEKEVQEVKEKINQIKTKSK